MMAKYRPPKTMKVSGVGKYLAPVEFTVLLQGW